MKLGTEVGLGLRQIVLNEDPAPVPQKRTTSQFSAHTRCGQTAGWIRMPLGMEVGIGTGHIVLDADPARLPQRGTAFSQFSAHVYGSQTVAHLSYW